MEYKGDARQRIILAAIDILNSEGVSGITTRRIAENAEVNSAALNYYYGSKDNLIVCALDLTLEHVFDDWKMILELEELDLPVRIYCLLDYTMEGILKYSGLVRSHLFDPLVKVRSRKAFAENTGSLLDMLTAMLDERMPQTREMLKLSIGQMLLTVMFAAMIPELFKVITEDDLTVNQARSRFILSLLKQFLDVDLTITEIIQSDIIRVRRLAFTTE
ncbi:MAG: TetR/AcrR family transcriptional regulator [Candidatus Aegiribacteria sp.]|nr:TetR/AcrR family transcriptional regulator [Candidatus Aegiribacteria sp.]